MEVRRGWGWGMRDRIGLGWVGALWNGVQMKKSLSLMSNVQGLKFSSPIVEEANAYV